MDRIGRRSALILGCVVLAFVVALLGVVEGALLPILTAISGFFTSLTYTWIVVYVPEIFPTERRGTCMGWTTTLARISYVAGPALAAVLLRVSPTMELFWVVTGAVILLPIGIMLLSNPYETKTRQLEEIEFQR